MRRQFISVLLAALLPLASFSTSTAVAQTASPTSSQTACNGSSCSFSAVLRQLTSSGMSLVDALGVIGAFSQLGFTFTAQGPGGPNRFALGGTRETGQAAAAAPTAWNGYVAAARANIGSSFQPTQAGGSVDVGLVGIDYTFGNRAMLGAAVSTARASVDTAFNGGNIRTNTTSLSPYLIYPLSSSWQLDANAGFGRSSTSTRDSSVAGGITGSNSGSSTSFGVGATYRMQSGRWGLSGRGALSTAESKQDSQTLSNNTFVAGSTLRTSTLRLGGQAAYNAGAVIPFAGLTYVYDFQKPVQGAVLGQTPANDKDAFQFVAGMQFRSQGALSGGIQLSSELGRKEVKNNSIVFNLGLRF